MSEHAEQLVLSQLAFRQTEQFIQDIAITELAKFRKATDWQSKYRIIMQLGKQLPALASEDKSEQTLVRGCESAAWLLLNTKPLQFAFDSEARVVKGIISLVLASWYQQDKNSDFLQLWQQLGLGAELSPSRNNGVFAVLSLMQQAQQSA